MKESRRFYLARKFCNCSTQWVDNIHWSLKLKLDPRNLWWCYVWFYVCRRFSEFKLPGCSFLLLNFRDLQAFWFIYSAIVAWKQARHGEQPTDVHHQTLPWTKDGLSLWYQTTTAADRPSILTVIENYMILRKLRAEGPNGFLCCAGAREGGSEDSFALLYLAIFNLLVEIASSLQVLDMPLVEIDDEDMRVLFNLATRCHTLRICESMKIDQTLPFLKATVRPRLQGRLHCRYHCWYHCSFTICNMSGPVLAGYWFWE
jgi:hypothetical protein